MRALTLGSCLAVAVTFAFSANVLLEEALRGVTWVALQQPRAQAAQRALDADRLSRTLGTPLQPRPPAAPTRPLQLKLLGTLDDHAAAVVDGSTGQYRTLRVGDSWNGVELVEVGHGRATIRRGGALEQLAVGAAAAIVTAAAQPRFPISFTPAGASLAMGRAELERQLPALAERAMAGGRIVPAFDAGVMTGFRLVAVRPGSLFEELGLKTGDVFETVNGASLTSPHVALGLMTGLRDQRHVALVVNRGGERLTWNLSLN